MNAVTSTTLDLEKRIADLEMRLKSARDVIGLVVAANRLDAWTKKVLSSWLAAEEKKRG
jgi:hypothetical protein